MIARSWISAGNLENKDMAMRVKDVMTPNVVCIGADEPVLKAARSDAPKSHQRLASPR